jgi:hypothetical protein
MKTGLLMSLFVLAAGAGPALSQTGDATPPDPVPPPVPRKAADAPGATASAPALAGAPRPAVVPASQPAASLVTAVPYEDPACTAGNHVDLPWSCPTTFHDRVWFGAE